MAPPALVAAFGALLCSAAQAAGASPCGDGAPGPAAARYRVTVSAAGAASQPPRHWHLLRGDTQIAWLKGRTEDLWHCDARGGMRLERVYRDERHVVDVAAGELRALDVDVHWPALATLFDERDIAALKRVGSVQWQGATLARHRGELRGERITLDWHAGWRLPARLVRQRERETVQFELLEAHAAAPADWPVPAADSGDFTRIDAADFGDMEHNAFVRQARARGLP
jgi:hypothetical protein